MYNEKYQHVEKLGHQEVEGLTTGVCYIFPKLDGSNGVVWSNPDGSLHFGSRNREIGEDGEDNQGFRQYVEQHKGIRELLSKTALRLYGEWLVPHTIKDYRDDAWRKFYVFDVTNHLGEYLTYEDYVKLMLQFDIDFIPPIKVIENPSDDDIKHCMDINTFLMKDGSIGEGVVVKRYGYQNKYGRVTWGKMVRNEFKDKMSKEKKTQIISRASVEKDIVDKYVDNTMLDKIIANIKAENDGWSSKYIPRLLQTAFYELVREEAWAFVKEFKYPIIDFSKLNYHTINKVKQLQPELF